MSTVRAAVKRWLDRRVAVACSGGADSIVLADAAIAGGEAVVVTIDHGLQEGSAEVAQGVRRWAEGLGARAVVRRVTVAEGGSLEEAARDARYRALEEVCAEVGAGWCLLAHTARDQAETVLMRVVRGTGPAGLVGIPEARGRWVRPLLGVSRDVIDAYARERGLPVWDDPMNRDLRFMRARVRERVMPALRAENPAIEEALGRLAESAKEWRDAIDAIAGPFARFPIDCAALARQPAAVVKRAIALALEREGIGYDAVHLEQVAGIVMREDAGTVEVPGGRFERVYGQLQKAGSPAPAPAFTQTADYEVRAWKPGDRMRPARLKGRSRKLSDLYADAKVPRAARREAQVMVRIADGIIVWAEHVGVAFGENIEEGTCPLRQEKLNR